MAKAKPHLRRGAAEVGARWTGLPEDRHGVADAAARFRMCWRSGKAPTSKQYYVLHHWVLKRRNGAAGPGVAAREHRDVWTFLERLGGVLLP